MNVLIFCYSTLFTVDTRSSVPIISLNDLKMKYTKGIRSVIHSNVKFETLIHANYTFCFKFSKMPYMYY